MRKFIITNLSKGAVSISSQQIVEVGDGASSGGNFLPLSGGTMTGNIKSPDASQLDELATLGQVDQAISEIDISADEVTETATREFVSPSEKTTWNAKQSKSPTDGKTYGLKDGGLIQITNNVTIADATNSIEVTSSTNTLVKEYDLGALTGKSILSLSFYFEKVVFASEIVQAEIWLYDTITTTEYRVARNQASAANVTFPIDRQITLNEVTGLMKGISPTLSNAPSDNVNSNASMVEQSVSFVNPMKLRTYLRNVAVGTASIRQFSALAILR